MAFFLLFYEKIENHLFTGTVYGNGLQERTIYGNRPIYGNDFFLFSYRNCFSVPVDLAYGNVYGNYQSVPVLNSGLGVGS